MNKEELKEQFAIDCTTLDKDGYTVVKGTPMDIINWIAEKFCLSNVMKSFPSDAELDDLALNYINDSSSVEDYNLKLEAFKGACRWWYEHGKGNVS